MNGGLKEIDVVDSAANKPRLDSDETSPQLSQMNLEMTFGHTLHVLEGIAAEDKDRGSRGSLTRATWQRTVIDSMPVP